MSENFSWVDTHCHLDAPEFAGTLPQIVANSVEQGVKAILLPAVKVSDC